MLHKRFLLMLKLEFGNFDFIYLDNVMVKKIEFKFEKLKIFFYFLLTARSFLVVLGVT